MMATAAIGGSSCCDMYLNIKKKEKTVIVWTQYKCLYRPANIATRNYSTICKDDDDNIGVFVVSVIEAAVRCCCCLLAISNQDCVANLLNNKILEKRRKPLSISNSNMAKPTK